MKRFVFSLVFALISVTVVTAQEAEIKGKIVDAETGRGLSNADITCNNKVSVSKEDGTFQLQLQPGNYLLLFSHVGFKETSRRIELHEGESLTLDIALEVEVAQIDQVVVSASRAEQKISELTVSMNLIKPELLSGQHITDTKELINKTPGIEVLDGQASVRGGSGFSYGAGSRVLALLDGLPVMAADAGNIRWGFLPLENIAQIEIIKGASSVAYGSSALNGVIHFRSADAGEKPETRFYAESGVYDSPSNHNWKWWDSPRVFSGVSFSHLRKSGRNDLAIGANLQMDRGYRMLNGQKSGRVNFRVKHQDKKVAGLSYGLSFNGGQAVKTDFVLWENALTGALKQDEATAIEGDSRFFTLDPFLSYVGANQSKHDIRARYQLSENKFPNSAKNDSRAANFYAEYQLRLTFTEKLSLNAGISENASRINSNFYGDHTSFNAGIFSQFEWVPVNRLRFSSGLRLEENWLDGEPDKLIPLVRSGLNYRLFNYTFIRASFGQGYRFPSIAEKFASTTLGSVKIFPSFYVQPEKGWSAELGAKQGISAGKFNGFVDAALFYTQNQDMIEYIFGIYPNPGEETFSYGFKATNTEASRVYGTEIQFMLTRTSRRLKQNITGGYVFMYPVEYNPVTGKNNGVMLKYRRKHSATLNYQLQWGNFESGASLYIKSRILNIDDVFLNEMTRESLLPGFYDYWLANNHDYFVADINFGYKLTRHFRLSAVVKNVFNKEYIGRPGDIQPPRSFSLRLSGSF